MKSHILKKDIIFFNPGISGTVFIHPAKQYISVEQLRKVQKSLIKKTNYPVTYIEDRRTKDRRQSNVQDFLSQLGRAVSLPMEP